MIFGKSLLCILGFHKFRFSFLKDGTCFEECTRCKIVETSTGRRISKEECECELVETAVLLKELKEQNLNKYYDNSYSFTYTAWNEEIINPSIEHKKPNLAAVCVNRSLKRTKSRKPKLKLVKG